MANPSFDRDPTGNLIGIIAAAFAGGATVAFLVAIMHYLWV
jgi:hypothetical protein